MSFVLHRAERADVLADALADVLAAPLDDPFEAEVVAVHSRGIERWLSNRLAARLGTSPGSADGVCANLELPFPGRLVGAALGAASGVDPRTDPWRPERLAWPLLGVVDDHLDSPWLAVLAGHLGAAPPGGAGGATAGHRDADRDRRFAAVRHLADLYDRYAVHRPSMLLAWAAGRDEDGDGAALPADAVWQAELWRAVRTVIGAPSPPERLFEGCAALEADPTVCDLPARVSLFGLTRLPSSYLEVLVALAAHRDVHVFALHPSPRSWETIRGAVEGPASSTGGPADGLDPALAATNPLLRAWGRDSREMHMVLAGRLAAVPGVIERHHALPPRAPASLLEHLQHAIRADESPTAVPALDPADRSVQVHACHGRARQAEVVHDAVTHLLAADPTLEPRDIVVMCPDIDEMAPFLRAAFDASVPVPGPSPSGEAAAAPVGAPDGFAIPYRLADRSIRQTNPVLGAVAALLELVDSRLTASQVLAFAGLGPVRERFRLDDDDLERVAQWVGATGIRWGLDARHRAPYDLAAVEAGTWDAGLQRLLLGVTMSEDGQRLVGGVLPLDDVDSGDIDLVGRVAELVGRLGDVVRDAEGARPVGDWLALVDRAADLLLHTRPADAWQRGQLDRLLAEVRIEAAGGDRPLRLAEIRDLLADRLRGRPSRAAFRTGDLTMCTLVPMRSVPHRVVCLVGLDDGAFPRGGAPDGDDLLVRARHLGDHDRRAEDRQLLLDAVLAASDALVVTYAGRDSRTNEVVPPAVPVNELLDVIDLTVTPPVGVARPRDLVLHQHPLRPSDPRCFTPGALGVDGPWSFDPHQLAGARASSGPRTSIGPFLATPLPPVHRDVVDLDELVKFVEHPAKAFVRQRLGLSTWDDDDRPLDRLSIELDHLEEWSVGDRVLTALLAGGDPDGVAAAEVARGLLPPGALGARVLDRARTKAVAIAGAAAAVSPAARGSLDVDVALPGGRRLVGTVPDVVADVVRATTYSRISAKRRLAAWVRFLAAVAAHPELPLTSVTVGWGGSQPATVGIGQLGATAAQRHDVAVAHLDSLVDLRDRGMREPIPLFSDTSRAYAVAWFEGDPDPAERAATCWTSTFDRAREDRDAVHVLVFDGERPWADVVREEPAVGEDGPGWALGEPTRFGRLARRLWDPVLHAPRRPRP